MKKINPVWKPVGWTPLRAVLEFKKSKPEFENIIVSYAGRLDPMAEGILILLVGNENKKRHKYEDLEKTYESEIILGISTDSYDGLGITERIVQKEIAKKEIEKELETFLGKQKQKYPPYSSKAVKGKSLYWWARNEKLDEIKIPARSIEIYSIKLLDYEIISASDLVKNIIEKVKLIEGDFRQKEIIYNWKNFEKENRDSQFIKIKINLSSSSGTYVRRIASDLGERLGSMAFAFSITRIGVGKFKKEDCINYF
ncbi:MAG: hypothetical protein KBD51_00745 [Candidatus Levybacteria bacterium]|nr:hypothetical protein [Candidatus Levybacteria bacterium]